MTLKIYNPTTSSRRGLVLVDRSHLWRGKPFKALTEGKLSTGGRCATGRITVRHKGGGHKKRYRMIDFRRREQGDAVVQRLEYDPNRSGFIALVRKEDSQENAYILAPEGVRPGDVLSSGNSVAIKPGNTLPLKNIPMGVFVHNVGMKVGKGGQIARSAGASAQIMGRDGVYVLVRLPSSEVRKIHGDCCATIGVMSNGDHKNRVIAKAGRNRWKGIRPTVRGVAMNPIDHPHGGGEGKTSGGRHPVTPWGVSTKGKKTRDRKRPSSSMIVTRRKK